MTQKLYINAQDLLQDSYELAIKMYYDKFFPDFIIGVSRGGTPIAIAVHEYFKYIDKEPKDIIMIRTESYDINNEQKTHVAVKQFREMLMVCQSHHKLLIVDDVFDSGRTMEAIVETLIENTHETFRGNIKIACTYYKPNNNDTDIIPDYYMHIEDKWLVFPHELCGLSKFEIRSYKPELAAILKHVPET